MGLLAGLTRNWATLDQENPDPALRPVHLPMSRDDGFAWVAARLRTWKRWQVVTVEPAAGTLHATHATWLWGFVDDVQLKLVPDGSGCRLEGESRSRVGKGDLGQNARNLRELTRGLRAALDG